MAAPLESWKHTSHLFDLCLAVREGESGESEVRRTVRYPDSHQLFVGNVPHDVDKNELKEFFERKWDKQKFSV